ncbi:hypothetical protein MAR_008619 [Mya arenaria]|uniref:Uncharacterized protein n=1 Tax=Mya arenaria TaxID=6604 RepID=A0ABY7DZF9_MYAAR|nr:hypothetical protein MAR_008619 [Mya arenaria]
MISTRYVLQYIIIWHCGLNTFNLRVHSSFHNVNENDEDVTQSDQGFENDVTRKSSSENDVTRNHVVVMMYKLCGIPLKASATLDDSKEFLYKETFMKEDPLWKNILNINAVIGCLVVVFLMGYFH